MIEFFVTDERSNFSQPKIGMHEREVPDLQAKLALSFVEKWGMVSGTDAGEDGTGRAKIRLLTPREVVNRACETAEILVEELRSRNWFVMLPPYKEVLENSKKAMDEAEAAAKADLMKAAADAAERRAERAKEK